MSAETYSDDRYGAMRVHVADVRARLACTRYTKAHLRQWALTHDVTCLRRSLDKRDLAWHMAQHGLIDADGNLRDGFPGGAS